MSLSSPSWPRNAATLPNCIFSELVFDGSLEILRVVVLAPENDDVLQPAADEQLPVPEEPEISGAKVGM